MFPNSKNIKDVAKIEDESFQLDLSGADEIFDLEKKVYIHPPK